ncbi:hypothetical protein D3C75_1085240 [compost metagenome]
MRGHDPQFVLGAPAFADVGPVHDTQGIAAEFFDTGTAQCVGHAPEKQVQLGPVPGHQQQELEFVLQCPQGVTSVYGEDAFDDQPIVHRSLTCIRSVRICRHRTCSKET